jgi:hypothetical protein
LLVVLAILAVAFGLVAIAGRGILQRSAERSVVNTVQQAVWQGATMAAARGVRTELVRDGDVLAVRRLADGEVLRTFELEPGATLNVSDGQVLVFTPPGSVLESSLDALPDPVRITAAGDTYELEVSLIGEVRVR